MYLIIAVILAFLALIFLLIPIFTKNHTNIKMFASIALSCLLLSTGLVAGSFFVKPEIKDNKAGYVEVIECIEEGSEIYNIEAIWI